MPAERRTLMFSATIPRRSRRWRSGTRRRRCASRRRPKAIATATSSTTRSRSLPRERDLAVVNLLRYHDAPGALVFCATRDGVTHLAANLTERGFSVAALSGELSQRERNQALQALRDGRARVCVATDVAARGLDLPDLGLVIHADLPQNAQVLVHRSGRTGRAGKHGLAILIVARAARAATSSACSTRAKSKRRGRCAPSADDIRVRDQDQLVLEIRALAEEPERRRPQGRAARCSPIATAEDLVAALVRLRRDARPAPEELTVPPSMRHRRTPSASRARSAASRTRATRTVDDRRRVDKGTGPPPKRRRPDGNAPLPPSRAPAQRARDSRRRHSVWFTINVGRSKNADPKWLIPLLCRRGNITKRAIGKIQILTRETRVEIAARCGAERSPKRSVVPTTRIATSTSSPSTPVSTSAATET